MFKKKIKPSPEATYKEVWHEGDIFTKLSFFIMGLAQLKINNGSRALASSSSKLSSFSGSSSMVLAPSVF